MTQPKMYKVPIYFPQSEKKTPMIPDTIQSAVCKVVSQYKQETSQGTGFLFEFGPQWARRSGLLTCEHVLAHREHAGPVIPPLHQITVSFPLLHRRSGPQDTFESIRDPHQQPIIDSQMDFAYVEVSPTFKQRAQQAGIDFLLPNGAGTLTYPEFFMVHYPGNVRSISLGRLYNSSPIVMGPSRSTSVEGIADSSSAQSGRQHIVSSKPGSSGAPLIDSNGEDGFVFAMHIGTDVTHEIDYSATIEGIISRIELRTPPPTMPSPYSWDVVLGATAGPAPASVIHEALHRSIGITYYSHCLSHI